MLDYKYKLWERISMRCVSIVSFICAGYNLDKLLSALDNIITIVILAVSIISLIGGGYWLMVCSFKRYGVE